MGIESLSFKLLRLGFFWVLGTFESSGLMVGHGNYVVRGEPLTWDRNNGVVVVYDEERRPWIIRRSDEVDVIIETLIRDFQLSRGAYVPHSNDGGTFIINVVSRL
jgi:hypothetical protein